MWVFGAIAVLLTGPGIAENTRACGGYATSDDAATGIAGGLIAAVILMNVVGLGTFLIRRARSRPVIWRDAVLNWPTLGVSFVVLVAAAGGAAAQRADRCRSTSSAAVTSVKPQTTLEREFPAWDQRERQIAGPMPDLMRRSNAAVKQLNSDGVTLSGLREMKAIHRSFVAMEHQSLALTPTSRVLQKLTGDFRRIFSLGASTYSDYIVAFRDSNAHVATEGDHLFGRMQSAARLFLRERAQLLNRLSNSS